MGYTPSLALFAYLNRCTAHSAAQARIIAARAKREQQKTAKNAKKWPKTAAGALRGRKQESTAKPVKQIPGK